MFALRQYTAKTNCCPYGQKNSITEIDNRGDRQENGVASFFARERETTMKTYDDVQAFTQVPESYWQTHGCPMDLRHDADISFGESVPHEWWVASAYNAESIIVLWYPGLGRAGVSYAGSPAAWTDADSAKDALERYLGEDGKEMDN